MFRSRLSPSLVNRGQVKSKFRVGGVRRDTETAAKSLFEYTPHVCVYTRVHTYAFELRYGPFRFVFVRSCLAAACFRMKFLKEEICQFCAK